VHPGHAGRTCGPSSGSPSCFAGTAHALLSDPEAEYVDLDLGPGYYDQRAGTARQARGHVRSLERLGYKVTIEPVDPGTGELTAKAS
jgi:hypothetical protein